MWVNSHSAYTMESFESLMIRRRQEIEVELMQYEVDAWAAIGKEEQVSVDDKERKLDCVTAELHRARISYRKVAAAAVNKLQVLSANVSAGLPRPRRFCRKDAQTMTEAKVPSISCAAGLQSEVDLAREEVETQQKLVELHENQSRLLKEPDEGKTFTGIRERRNIEDAALDEVAKKIANLEREVTETERISADLFVFRSEDPGEWVSDLCCTEAPWDEDDIEIVPVQVAPPQTLLRPAGVQTGAFQGALQTGVQAPRVAAKAGVTQAGASRPPGTQRGTFQIRPRPSGLQTGCFLGVVRPTVTPSATSQHVFRPTAILAAASPGVLRPTGAQAVLRPTGVRTAAFQGVPCPTRVQAPASQGVLRPTGVQSGSTQSTLCPTGVQAGSTLGVLRPTGVRAGVPQGRAFATVTAGRERAAAPGWAADSSVQTRSQPAAQPCQPGGLQAELQEDMGMSWPASVPPAHGAAASTSKARFVPKKPFLSRLQPKN